jgi:hypothetical protein
MDAIRKEVEGLSEKIARLDAKRDKPGILVARYELHTVSGLYPNRPVLVLHSQERRVIRAHD